MKTEFKIRTWRKIYDQINILGLYLKDSRPDWDGNPPQFRITLEERFKIEKEIEELMKMSDTYMDKCKLYPNEPKWYYDRNNETTWASSEKFAFTQLLPRKKYLTISI